jgi:hypothetical protein
MRQLQTSSRPEASCPLGALMKLNDMTQLANTVEALSQMKGSWISVGPAEEVSFDMRGGGASVTANEERWLVRAHPMTCVVM